MSTYPLGSNEKIQSLRSRDIFYNKNEVQVGVIIASVVALIAFAIAYGVTAGSDNNILKKIGALFVDPETHSMTSISGAMIFASSMVVGLVFWAVMDSKDNHFFRYIESLFVEKTEEEKVVLGSVILPCILSIPFVLLAAQGCAPFKQGWDNFADFFAKSTGNVGSAIAASLIACTTFMLLMLFAVTLVGTIAKKIEWIEKKTTLQGVAITLFLGISMWAIVFAVFAAKGIWDGAWSNLKHLIIDKTSDPLSALPAVGIIMGAAFGTAFVAYGFLCDQESSRTTEAKWQALSPFKKGLHTLASLVFIASIPLIIMGLKGVTAIEDLRCAFVDNPILCLSITVLVLAVASLALTYFYKK